MGKSIFTYVHIGEKILKIFLRIAEPIYIKSLLHSAKPKFIKITALKHHCREKLFLHVLILYWGNI
jgi:hypothetical protein